MSAHRTTRRPVLRAVLILLAAVLVLAGLYAFLRGRAAALAEGAAFGFDYTVTSTAAEPSPAYAVLEALDALSGSITGQTSGDSLYICWYSPPLAAFQTEQAPGPDQAFTDLYVKDGTVYLNVRQLYRSFLSGLIGVVTGLLSLVIFICLLTGMLPNVRMLCKRSAILIRITRTSSESVNNIFRKFSACSDAAVLNTPDILVRPSTMLAILGPNRFSISSTV